MLRFIATHHVCLQGEDAVREVIAVLEARLGISATGSEGTG